MAELRFPEDLFYAKSDEWVRIEGDTATIGISDYAQDALNDIVYVELPEVGDTLDAGDQFGSLESVKAASDLYTFVSGEVIAVNGALEEEPEIINSDPYGKGWILKIKLSAEPDTSALMDSDAYKTYCEDR